MKASKALSTLLKPSGAESLLFSCENFLLVFSFLRCFWKYSVLHVRFSRKPPFSLKTKRSLLYHSTIVSLPNRISCFDIFVASLGKGFVFNLPIITSACEKRNACSLYKRNSYKLAANTCSWHTSEELLLLLLFSLLLLLLLLPFGMISIFSLSSSHDAVTNVVELMTTFGCVLGSSDSILSSSSKNGGFLLGVASPILLSSSLYWRYAVTRVWRRVLQASPSRSSYPQAIKKSPISCHIGFFLVQDFSLSWTFSSPQFSSKSLVSLSSHVLPRTFVWSRHFEVV